MNLSQLNRVLLQLLLLPVLALSVLSGVFVWQIVTAVRTVERIQLADRNIELTTSINTNVVDEETGLRGYQITANEIFLQPYQYAEGPLQRDLQDLRKNIAQQHGDVTPVDELTAAHVQWHVVVADPIIRATANGEETRDAGTNLRGKARMDAIRRQITAINQQQRDLRSYDVEHFQITVRHTIEGAIGLALMIGLMIGVFSRGQLHAVTAAFQRTLQALRKNTEEVQRSEERLRTILGSIGDGVVVCNREGRIEMVNAVARALTGWTAEEAVNRPVEEVFHFVSEGERAPVTLPILDVLERREWPAPAHHAVLVRRDGTEISVDSSGAPVVDARGTVTGAVMVFRDVTEQRQTQAALLASEKLAVAGRLAATIAHEIHNPLDAVINLMYLLRNDPTPEETQSFLAMASSELDRVAQISRAMLGMYRESKTPVAIELGELLRSLLLLLEHHFLQAGVTVVSELEAAAVITGYPAELRQVFTNLLTNALDASKGGDTVAVGMKRSGDGMEVTIADEGPGFPVEAIAHLFQPFFTTKGEHGTGLGLWVSHGILQKHGGTIRVEAREGGGTVMTVWLPRGVAAFRG